MKQPENFGKFLLLGQVAIGGMAEIYKARFSDPTQPQIDLAIKRILPSYTEDEGFVTMFKDEGNIALRLSHPNIVKVYEVGEVNNDWYMAMEFIHGSDIRVISDACEKMGKRFTPVQVARIICEVAKALDYAHQCSDANGTPLNIVHRDCTPHNIMLTYDGLVKLMDFGIAKAASRATKTRVGTVKGKSSYMSPEQARGKALDGRSDMFTLGSVGWELLTGHRLFKASSDFEILSKVLKSIIIHPSDLNADIPRPLGDIIMKMLERDRDQRYATCGRLAEALEAFLTMHGDGSDAQLGYFITALMSKQGHSPNELPDFVPGPSLFRITDSGNFEPINPHHGSPVQAPSINTDAFAQQNSMPSFAPQSGAFPMQMQMQGQNQGMIPPAPVYPGDMLDSGSGGDKPIGLIITSVLGFMLALGLTILGIFLLTLQPEQVEAFTPPESNVDFKSTPPGATIIVNGEALSSPTPFYAYKTKLGEELRISFELDGYEPEVMKRQVLFMTQDFSSELMTTEEAAMQRLGGFPTFVINTDPPGATITINGKEAGKSPLTLNESVKFGEELKITATPSDSTYQTANRVIIPTKGGEASLNISFEKAKIAVAAPPPRRPSKPSSSKNIPAGTGTLVIKAKPWAAVSIDGKRVGTTPVTRPESSGTHKIDITFPSKNKTASKRVTLRPNQKLELGYDFNTDTWF